MNNQCCCNVPVLTDANCTEIRPALVEDIPAIKELISASIRKLCSAHYTAEQIEKWIHQKLNEDLEQKQDDVLWIALHQEAVVGMIMTEHKTGMIRSLFVHPDHIRKKIGLRLLMDAHFMSYSAKVPQLTAYAPMNAVEFFRSNDFTEVGPDFIVLEDGTKLPCLKMEQVCYRALEFSDAQSISEQVRATLECDDRSCMLATLCKLREKAPAEMLEEIVRLLHDPDQKIRRRATAGLGTFSKLKGGEITVEQKAQELSEYLMHGPDETVRLSCAIHLMPIRSELVDRAFLHALNDSFDKVAQLACSEVGWRETPEGSAALFDMLNHPGWQVRLTACNHLIRVEKADDRVVARLETMSREPEGLAYDAEMAESKEFRQTMAQAFCPNETPSEVFETFDSILTKAREVAEKNRRTDQA